MTRWRSIVALLPLPARPLVCLFCDFEGHHAGEHAGRTADAGTDALLSLFHRIDLRITFNIVADLCRTHPDRIQRIAAAGHDIACHGWRHERPRDLTPSALDSMLTGAIEAFASLGLRPTGFRSPESDWSWPLMEKLPAHGFRWNAERDPARGPYRIRPNLVRLPVRTDDWDLTEPGSGAAALLAKWQDAVIGLRETGGVLCLGIHEWIVGANREFAEGLETTLANWQKKWGCDFGTLTSAAQVPDSGTRLPTRG